MKEGQRTAPVRCEPEGEAIRLGKQKVLEPELLFLWAHLHLKEGPSGIIHSPLKRFSSIEQGL